MVKTFKERVKGKIKVRVTFKNPIGKKTGTMWIKPEYLKKERAMLKTFSPYKSIRVVKKKK